MPAAGSGHPLVRRYIDAARGRLPGVLALEGTWALHQALHGGLTIEAVFRCAALLREDLAPVDAPVTLDVAERVLRRMVQRDGPDGVAALAVLPTRTLADVPIGDASRVVVVDAVDLPGNLGTIIRCADGAGASGVVVTQRRIRVHHPLVLKASMGTLLSMPVVDASRADALAWLRANAVRVVAAHPAAEVSYRDADYRGAVAIVLGSERNGLDRFWLDAADVTVAIPMLGVADSLNVGHAAALLLYEAALPRTRATQPGSSARSSSPHSRRRWPADG